MRQLLSSLQVLEMVRPAASKRGLETPVELWGYFVEQCRQRLHVVLCMSPIGNAFRDRLRQNPSLINCCTIDWFQGCPCSAYCLGCAQTAVHKADQAIKPILGQIASAYSCCGSLSRHWPRQTACWQQIL